MTEFADHDPSAAPGAASGHAPSSYADIGERVAGVLAAAEAAANQIREDARSEAEGILGAARLDADTLRQEAAAYDADTRAAVESYVSERRREAALEVEKHLAESEAQARATRHAAEAITRQIEYAERQRGEVFREVSEAVEDRLTEALLGFRRMTADVEGLLGTPAVSGESLTDALKPTGPHTEEAQPLVAVPTEEIE